MVCACCNLDGCPSGGACCVDGECVDGLSEAECQGLGGTWQGCCSRCHPTGNAGAGTATYPCGDTSTPTCCDAFAARYSQIVITLSGLVGTDPGVSDCSCMNSTYVFDLDIGPVAGALVQELVSETVPGALSGCPFGDLVDVVCEVECISQKTTPGNIEDGVLSLTWKTFGQNIRWQYERVFVFLLTLVVVGSKSADGNVCTTTCDDLVDNIDASVSVTFSSSARCDRSNATASATFQ